MRENSTWRRALYEEWVRNLWARTEKDLSWVQVSAYKIYIIFIISFSIPSLEDIDPVPLQEEFDLPNLSNEPSSPQNGGDLLVDDEIESEKRADLPNISEETIVKRKSPVEVESGDVELDDDLNTIQDSNFESNENLNFSEKTTISDAK